MSALAQATARGDIILVRGATNEWAVLWEQSADGDTYAPVNVGTWRGTFALRSLLGEEWLTRPALPSANGTTVFRVGPDDLTAPEWDAREGGVWVATLTAPDGRIERLGSGYFALEA